MASASATAPRAGEEPSSTVLYSLERQGSLARITMNRPRKGNAFNPEMIQAMHAALDRAIQDQQVRVVLLTGAGKYFCTGMDLSAGNQSSLNHGGKAGQVGSSGFIDLCNKLRDCPKPVVARVNGPVMGGGNGLLFCCDVRLASSRVWFQFSEVKRGLVPAMISTFIVPQLGLFHSRELFLSGRRLPALRALQIGFLTELAHPLPHQQQGKKGKKGRRKGLSKRTPTPPTPPRRDCDSEGKNRRDSQSSFRSDKEQETQEIEAKNKAKNKEQEKEQEKQRNKDQEDELKEEEEALDSLTQRYVDELLSSAPAAMTAVKQLVSFVHSHSHSENVVYAQQAFWKAMKSAETRYGLEAFRERRTPDWSVFLRSRL